jgi:NAD(P)-dependent dehydrogenase (short-subunit alcohol dehydrogenase family)
VPTALVTGANRGIGLELTRQYLREGWRVIATCRFPPEAESLQALAADFPERAEIHALSVTDWRRVTGLSQLLEDRAIHLLLNNAAVRHMDAYHLGKIDPDAFLDAVAVNALGALKVAEAFVPQLSRAGKSTLVMVSSNLGSISKNRQGGDYAYRASKAAMNAVMRSLAVDLEGKGITVISLHPGWVRTDMGGKHAPLSPEESVTAIRKVLSRVGPEDSGRFLRFDGHEELW